MSGQNSKRRIVITGATGRIGMPLRDYFTRSLHYDLVLTDRETGGDSSIHCADLSRYNSEWTQLLVGADSVIHLAGEPSPAASWESVSKNNIEATFNLFQAAAENGVRRVVYASSLQTMEGYRFGRGQIATDAQPRPVSFYGMSKLMGESIARRFVHERGLSAICLRIGSAQTGQTPAKRNLTAWQHSKWLTAMDLHQATERAILTEDIRFAILPVISDNAGMRWDLSETRRVLGYEPTKRAALNSPTLTSRIRETLVFAHRRLLDPAWRYYRD